jgi:protein-S-isoprenylcysteine O-methyltransferase Ste14
MIVFPLLAMLLYGVIHSLLASATVKKRARALIGQRAYEGFYRLFFNIAGAVTFIPVVLVVLLTPARTLWQIPFPWAAGLLLIQLIGLFALVLAVLQADPLRFAGLKQALAYLRGEPLPLPQESLQIGGFYGFVRHPLYLFSLLVLWPSPIMTDTYLAFAAGATVYFIIGSRLEEQRLAREFGDDYRQYQRRVPWLLPWPRPRR